MIDTARALPCLQTARSPDETAGLVPYGKADAVVVRAWIADLAVSYIVEEADAPCFVRWRDIEDEGVERLHAIALENLRARAATHLTTRADGPIVGVFLDGKLDAGVLLLDEPWERDPALSLAAPLVAIAARRDLLAVASGSSPDGIAVLRSIAERTSPTAEGHLSRRLLVRSGGNWASFDPE